MAEAAVLTSTEFDYALRDRNDAETWLAEVLPGAMRTPFEYSSDGTEIFAEDGGALTPVFEDAIVDARRIVHKAPELAFELRRRLIERDELADMLAMVRGELPNTMIVESDFPPELMDATEDVGGYNVKRQQTMLRVITYSNGRLKMYSQSLDGSDRRALEAIYAHYGLRPEDGELLGQRIHVEYSAEDQPFVVDELTGVYDRSLTDNYDGEWYAGRRDASRRNTYDFVCQQHDLINRYVEKQQAGELTKRERYNIAALMVERYEGSSSTIATKEFFAEDIVAALYMQDLSWQLELAGDRATASGKTFSGCGASAGPGDMSASEQLEGAGYGNMTGSDEDDKGPLTFKCKNGHTNRRPRGKLINQCWVKSCKDSVGC